MHEIDMELKLQLEGKHKEARAISDRLQAIGSDKILDPNGKNTQDIWFRHSFNRGWFLLQDGDYQEGCKLLEHGRFLNVYGSPPLKQQHRFSILNKIALSGNRSSYPLKVDMVMKSFMLDLQSLSRNLVQIKYI